jgi:hypothetical protein
MAARGAYMGCGLSPVWTRHADLADQATCRGDIGSSRLVAFEAESESVDPQPHKGLISSRLKEDCPQSFAVHARNDCHTGPWS